MTRISEIIRPCGVRYAAYTPLPARQARDVVGQQRMQKRRAIAARERNRALRRAIDERGGIVRGVCTGREKTSAILMEE